MTVRRHWFRWLLAPVLVVGLWLTPVPAAAQQSNDEEVQWTDVGGLADEYPWIQWLAAAIFATGILFLAFKNPHRSHLD